MLRGKKPEYSDIRLKMAIYGGSSTGKTFFSASFPNVYYIDCEGSAKQDQYIELLNKNNSSYLKCQDFNEVEREIRVLHSVKHDYKTLVIDPFSVLYDDLIEKVTHLHNTSSSNKDDDRPIYKKANKILKNFYNLITDLDMNIILVCRAKPLYTGNMVFSGSTFAANPTLEYIVDLLLESRKVDDKLMAFVQKSRLRKLLAGEKIDLSYESLCQFYDRKILEKDSTPVPSINKDQQLIIEEKCSWDLQFNKLILNWVDKKGYGHLSEMTFDEASKWIDYIKKSKAKEEDINNE